MSIRSSLSALTTRKAKGAGESALCQLPQGAAAPAVLVTLLGADADQTRRAVERHGKVRSYRPVFVVSNPDTRPLLGTGLTCEHVCGLDDIRRHRLAGDWPSYVTERWRMIHTKWKPAWSVAYALSFNDYLSEVEKCVTEKMG